MKRSQIYPRLGMLAVASMLAAMLAACVTPAAPPTEEGSVHSDTSPAEVAVADLQPAVLAGERLQVVATTNLVGDVVRRIGGDRITLTVLLPPGSDPHSYTATPQDMVTISNAAVLFVNGLGLEEALLPTLAEIGGAPVVSVNEGLTPLEAEHDAHAEEEHADEAGDEHAHEGGDPHTWQDVRIVRQWALTAAAALSALDPANAEAYTAAGAAYAAELEALHAELIETFAVIPAERRKLVTDHDTFRYFAEAYDFTVVGAVVPSFSTLATISAQEMAALQDQIAATGAPALFVGSTVNPRLAEQVAQDAGIPLTPLYTDSLGAAGSGAESYPDMMRANAAAIVAALR